MNLDLNEKSLDVGSDQMESNWPSIPRSPFTMNSLVQSLQDFKGNDEMYKSHTRLREAASGMPSIIPMVSENEDASISQMGFDIFKYMDKPRLSVLSEGLELNPRVGSTVLGNQSRDEKLLELSERTGYNLVQRNGQRIYGPPPDWKGEPPCRGCEVFVGKVPRDCYEEELVPIFERAGKIYELRLMMDFSGSNRGYLFVRYTKKEEAEKAIIELNNFEIRPGKHIGVVRSVDNRKLRIYGLPKFRHPHEIQDEMSKLVEGVYDVQIGSGMNRGCFFVEFETHRAAAIARKTLVPGKIFIFGTEITKVDWAQPETDDFRNKQLSVLLVRNVALETTENSLYELFASLSGDHVQSVKKVIDHAYVHFTSKDAAEVAFCKSRCLILDGAKLQVKWSKPLVERKLTPSQDETFSPTPRMNTRGQPICFSNFPYQACTPTLFPFEQVSPPRPLSNEIEFNPQGSRQQASAPLAVRNFPVHGNLNDVLKMAKCVGRLGSPGFQMGPSAQSASQWGRMIPPNDALRMMPHSDGYPNLATGFGPI